MRNNVSAPTSAVGTDLLIEEDTKSPILQIALGQFIRYFVSVDFDNLFDLFSYFWGLF